MRTDPEVDERARRHAALAGSSRVALLDMLAHAERPMTVQELATAVGLHVNTVRAHLDRLVDAGFAVRATEQRNGVGRPHVLYARTPAGAPPRLPTPRFSPDVADIDADADARLGGDAEAEAGEGYRFLATVLATHLASVTDDPAREAVAAGKEWGRWLVDRPAPSERVDAAGAVGRVARVLAAGGFEPEPTADATTIRLHHCPFRRLAQAQPGVICGVHLGILQGAFDELGAPVTAARLEPFVRPDLCLAHIERRPVEQQLSHAHTRRPR